ncbi:uncharacterized protein LOC106157082 [Lingula anatina]|uniref:Uncharacterized protein LOC106157082 n=1 Tax=Lingula anatina TaxID=7574 RepID=A0A2R2MJF3_LINAN|nr:uncharacterized protein LOC106157082 [Lingula anatina]|eukprot:XP_023930207.1 uncharacterized protein LOC106157082 [Lingula anatina]
MQPADLDFDFDFVPAAGRPGDRRGHMPVQPYQRRRRPSAFQRLWSKLSSTSTEYDGQIFDNDNMRAVSIMMAAVAIVVIGSLAIASASRDAIPSSTVELTLSVLFALSAFWVFALLLLAWRGKLTTDIDYRHKKNNQMTFQKIGAIIFGTGGMLYNILRISEYMNTEEESCKKVESVIMSVFYICFISVQVYFLLLFSKVRAMGWYSRAIM